MLCILVVMIVTCAAAEGVQQATGTGPGCAMMDLDPVRHGIECFVQGAAAGAGVGEPCPE